MCSMYVYTLVGTMSIITEVISASSKSADSLQVVHVDHSLGSSIWNRSFVFKGISEENKLICGL